MSTHNIQFHDKIRKFPLVFVFLSCRQNFVGTQKWVRINHGKRAIGVRAIEVRLYISGACFRVYICMQISRSIDTNHQYYDTVSPKDMIHWCNDDIVTISSLHFLFGSEAVELGQFVPALQLLSQIKNRLSDTTAFVRTVLQCIWLFQWDFFSFLSVRKLFLIKLQFKPKCMKLAFQKKTLCELTAIFFCQMN